MLELNNNKFNHIKVHTQYSICEGAIKIGILKDFCKEKKIQSIGLSDTANLCGALEFSENISKVGTQPIIGTQINFKFKDTIGLLPLIALNEKGYKKIIELSSKTYLENNTLSEPHLDIEELYKDTNGVLVFSGTINGFFGKVFSRWIINLVACGVVGIAFLLSLGAFFQLVNQPIDNRIFETNLFLR